MAVKEKTKSAVATRPGTSLVSMKDAIAKDIMSITERTGAPGGDMIRVTQDKKFVTPDGEVPGPLKLVIVDFVTQRSFYDRAFDRKNPCPPACTAISTKPTEMAPFKDVPVRQSDNCAGCPMNEWGSDGDGKACKEHRLVAVIPVDADAETKVSVISVSPTAIKPFDGYIRSLGSGLQKAPWQIITEVSFADEVKHASLRFGNPQPADEDLQLIAFNLRESARERLLAKPDLSGYTALANTKKKR